jgi:hypothetical protein
MILDGVTLKLHLTFIEVYGRRHVYVQRPVSEAYNAKYMITRAPHSDRVGMWGCFCALGIGQGEVWKNEEFTAMKYVDILRHNLLATVRHFYPSSMCWFQQDNAPQHTSRLATTFFHNNGIDIIEFPPYSPDLNPIENLWSIIKAQVEEKLPQTTEQVEIVLKHVWEEIDSNILLHLIESMPARCKAVIENEGHRVGY